LQRTADCPDARCVAELLRDNAYDQVDGLVLERSGDELVLRFMTDDFPDRTRSGKVVWSMDLFAEPYFERVDVGRWSVIVVR
jgi:hypothetical protein